MILILSEQKDISTDKVCEWLNYYKVSYLRLDEDKCDNIIKKIHFYNNNLDIIFKYNGIEYNLNSFSVVWCRRGYFNILTPFISDYFTHNTSLEVQQIIQRHLQGEAYSLVEFISDFISTRKHINNFKKYNYNKLTVLQKATESGILIPETIICKKIEDMPLKDPLITKTIKDIVKYEDGKYAIDLSVKSFKTKDIKNNTNFYYSLFQKQISRTIEIRTFIFLKKVYSIAIFPKDKKITDIRNGNNFTNRMVAFKLPKHIKQNLLKLLKLLGIESASVDMIYDGSHFTFLELNPAGQFDFVSVFGNYQIEKMIAKELSTLTNKCL